MIELLFVACLSTAPTECRERSMLFDDRVGLMTCMVQAQTQLAIWAEAHPKLRVREWHCRVARIAARTA